MTISSHSDDEAEKPEAAPAIDPNVIISQDLIIYNRLTRRSSQRNNGIQSRTEYY